RTLAFFLFLAACAETVPPRAASAPLTVAHGDVYSSKTCNVTGPFREKGHHVDSASPEYLLHEPIRECGRPRNLHAGLEIIGNTCEAPFADVHVRALEAAGMDPTQSMSWNGALYDKKFFHNYFGALLDTVKDIVDPACVFDADKPAR